MPHAATHAHAKKHDAHPHAKSTAITKAGEQPKKRAVWKSVLKWSAVIIIAREAYYAFGARRQRKRDIFNLAQYQANQTHKDLVVIGDPDGGLVNRFIGRDYDCGKLCIDATGCLQCTNHAQGRLEDILPTMPSNSAVIYVNGQLERVEDIDKVLTELQRVSGGDLYVVRIDPWTLTSLFWPNSRRQLFEAPPDDPRVRWRPLPWRSQKGTATVFEMPPPHK